MNSSPVASWPWKLDGWVWKERDDKSQGSKNTNKANSTNSAHNANSSWISLGRAPWRCQFCDWLVIIKVGPPFPFGIWTLRELTQLRWLPRLVNWPQGYSPPSNILRSLETTVHVGQGNGFRRFQDATFWVRLLSGLSKSLVNVTIMALGGSAPWIAVWYILIWIKYLYV